MCVFAYIAICVCCVITEYCALLDFHHLMKLRNACLFSYYKLLSWQHCRYDDDGGGDMYSDVDDLEPIVSIAALPCIYYNNIG